MRRQEVVRECCAGCPGSRLTLPRSFVATAGFRPAGLTDGETPPAVVTNAAAAVIAEPPRPAVGARAALLVDADSGQTLFEQGATEPLPPASTTKLMTALLAVESGRYFDPVTIEAADLVGGSSMGLTAGETLNLRDLLDGLLIASGNDAAYAVARHLGDARAGAGSAGGPLRRPDECPRRRVGDARRDVS